MKNTSRFFLVLLVALLTIAATSGNILAQDINPYTFGYMAFPDDGNDQYRFTWLRVGARMTPTTDLPGQLLVRTEFDISRDSFDGAFKYGYVQYNQHREGVGDFSVIGGKFLGPVHYTWPGPQQTRVLLMTGAQRGMSLYNTGLQVRYKGPVDVRLAHINDDTTGETAFTGWACFEGLQLFFVEDLARGAALVRSENWWFNISTGVVHYTELDEDRFWAEYYLEHRGVRLSAVMEMVEFEDEEFSFTLDIPYARFSSLRAGYCTQDEAIHGGLAFSY